MAMVDTQQQKIEPNKEHKGKCKKIIKRPGNCSLFYDS